jgi:L-rhamnonate dehydratase
VSKAFTIKDVRVFTLASAASGGTYFKPGEAKHWMVDSLISNPMSGYAKYREKRSSWGISMR